LLGSSPAADAHHLQVVSLTPRWPAQMRPRSWSRPPGSHRCRACKHPTTAVKVIAHEPPSSKSCRTRTGGEISSTAPTTSSPTAACRRGWRCCVNRVVGGR